MVAVVPPSNQPQQPSPTEATVVLPVSVGPVRGHAAPGVLRRLGSIYTSRRTARGRGPATILSIYIVLLLLIPSRIVLPGVGATGTIANVFILASLVWYGVSWLMRRITPARYTRLPRLAMFFFAVAVLLSYIAAARRDSSALESSAADRALIQLVTWFAVVLIATSLREYADLERLLRIFVRCAAVIGAVAILEFLFKTSLTAWMTLPGFSNSGPELITRGDFVRPTSTAANTLELATVMALALPFALQQGFNPVRKGLVRNWLPVAVIAMSAVMTVSRTSVIGLALVFLTLLPTWPAKRLLPTMGALTLGVGFSSVALPGLIGTVVGLFSAMLNGGDNSTNSRTATSAVISQYFDERPWTGRGYGTFLPLMYRYTDNEYLLALVEMGILGVAAVVLVYIVTLHCGGAGRRRFADPARRETGQGFAAGGFVMLVVTATFDTLSFPMVAGLSFLMMGLAGAYLGMARQDQMLRGEPSL
ncbi:O-antigen ligase family protein [Dactylosporangium sp. McL0621]|uniref:O-antigen ligase family protein n=1 Tax=Dactylosporangium sp. McL0621 TaxID=3415678 RepID=UPI003CED0618